MLSLRCCREVCQSRISAIASLWTPRAEPAGRGGALRISYHTYRGLPGVLASLCDGVLFGLAYLQRRQLWPLILTHTVVIERDESRREELLHDQQSAGGRHGNESRMVEGAAVQNCLSRPEVGGWGRKSFSRFWLWRRPTGVALDVTLLTSGRGSSETRKPSALAGVGVTPMADEPRHNDGVCGCLPRPSTR